MNALNLIKPFFNERKHQTLSIPQPEMYIRIEWFLVIILSVQVQNFSACDLNQTCLHDIEHDVEEAFHLRHKRWLTMIPNGGVCQIVLSTVAPVRFAHKVVRSVGVAVNLQANYAIPGRIIWPHAENFFKERVLSEDYVDNSRKDLYRLLERIFQSWGGDGRECLLKTICQVAETPLQHNGLIGEILDVVFTPPDDDAMDEDFKMAKLNGASGGEECAQIYNKCLVEHEFLNSISILIDITMFK
ncbi:uncharacterized protein LOC120421222 [Culex pipiens pallens]|uniref:uncharacterized protein LOC120421222 n=1 Tax=Culex pipiens pallens TaxID=42434 RepID=UPI0022AA8400|nr:uncharacterized protein LOC120421222 [Culex pipiens pallens]